MIAMFYNLIWSQSTNYNWADVNNMLFNASKFDYLSFACKNNSLSSNVYVNPDLNIINQHDNIKDLGILMSSDCSFEKHILSVSSRQGRIGPAAPPPFGRWAPGSTMQFFMNLS